MTNEELIEKAAAVINRHYSKDRLFGDVGAVVVSQSDKMYTGVCLDIPGVGICAERAAMAAMATNKEYRIKQIVAVWRDEKDDKLYVLPPCGICRQFMQYLDEANLDADVILGKDSQQKLGDLLPEHDWPEPLE